VTFQWLTQHLKLCRQVCNQQCKEGDASYVIINISRMPPPTCVYCSSSSASLAWAAEMAADSTRARLQGGSTAAQAVGLGPGRVQGIMALGLQPLCEQCSIRWPHSLVLPGEDLLEVLHLPVPAQQQPPAGK
jgi:hypothetical protein